MKPMILHKCPTCRELTAHETVGIQQDLNGTEYQTVTCLKPDCRTSTKIYVDATGKDHCATAE